MFNELQLFSNKNLEEQTWEHSITYDKELRS